MSYLKQPAVYSRDDPPTSASNLLSSPSSIHPHPALLRNPSSTRSAFTSPSTTSLPESSVSFQNNSVANRFALLDSSVFPDASVPEPDDHLHNPDPRRDKHSDTGGTLLTSRGFANLGCLFILITGIVMLFAGYPLISHFTKHSVSYQGAFGMGGTNGSGQVPVISNNYGLIDIHTPQSAWSRASYHDPSKTLDLVWSDEFNVDGRTFYPGDDPYWEALDLNYWQTEDVEWYDPAAITTKDGFLQITLSQKETHDLHYQGGMLSTWNQFCFTGGLIETAVVLPGSPDVLGFWPAVWTMGNLGRVGYGASTDGMWPYTYDSCDFGTIANQSLNGKPAIDFVEGAGDKFNGNSLSYLPGQRLSRCTCPGESHPGPVHSDGTYVGRAAPEIDIFEALATTAGNGNVSQSGQFAPFNWAYEFPEQGNLVIDDPTISAVNPYAGGVYQQAISALSITNESAYELTQNLPAIYAVEYQPGFDNSYITWVNNAKRSWTLLSGALVADNKSEIGRRPVSQEPMYIIANLGMSSSFVKIDFEHLTFPATMKIDYIRVYQDPDAKNIGCDPKDFPTQDYINTYIEAYTNPNLTTWEQYGQNFPKNSFLQQCSGSS